MNVNVAFINEMERRRALQPGVPVTYQTIRSGLVKCVIHDRVGDTLHLRVTSRGAYAYPCGLIFTTHAGPFVQAR
jgi:hypothetical protein